MKKLYFYLGVVALFCSCNDILQDGNMDGLQSMPDNGKEESIEQQILHIIEGFNGGNDQSLQTRALGNNDEIEFTNIQRKDIVYEPSISAKMTNASIQYTDTVPVYYVEFRKNGTNGFSIVTTDYRFPGVFAYSENGCLADTVYNKGMALVLSQIPAYCQSIMEEHLNIVDKPQTRTAIDYIEIGDLLMGKYEEKRWINSEKEAILEIQTPQWVSKIEDKPDILKTKWHQEAPYNNLCPSTSCETHAYAGCVAIAIAQICAYYQQPNNYDWNLLTENPQIQDSETEAAQEVARLIRNIGEDVDMNYQCGGSGATPENARNALIKYGYTCSDFSSAYNIFEMKDERDASRPVYMRGKNASGTGHAWVMSGYRTITTCDTLTVMTRDVSRFNTYDVPDIPEFIWEEMKIYCPDTKLTIKNRQHDYIYVNWGWGGTSDGYYNNTLLLFDTNIQHMTVKR